MDIIFINPPLTAKDKFGALSVVGSSCPPMNLLNLAAMTRKHGFETKIIDCEILPGNLNEQIDYILSFNPKYVGVTASTLQIYAAASLAELIKKKRAEVVCVIGGNHMSALPEDTMKRFPYFDFGVIGEGDTTIVELLNALERAEDVSNVKGISYRTDLGLKITPLRPLIENLDELPFPAWDLLDNIGAYLPAAQRISAKLSAYIITARGCPFPCSFCSRSVLGRRYRVYSMEYLKNMIQFSRTIYDFDNLTVFDENLTVSKNRLKEFCLLMQEMKLTWSCDARVDLVDRETLRLMADSGCWLILYGIESGSDKVLEVIKKNTTVEQNRNAVRMTREAGIKSSGFLMIGNPGETHDTLSETIELAGAVGLDFITPFFFTPLPGSEIYNNWEKYGEFENDWKKLNTFVPLFIPHGLTKNDLLLAYKKMLVKFYLKPSFILSQLLLSWRPVYIKRLLKGGISLIRTLLMRG